MNVEAVLRYDEAIVRRAALASWRRAFGLRYVAVLVLATAGLLYLVGTGDRSWFVGMIGALLAVAACFALAAYVISVRSSLKRLHGMSRPEASFRAGDEGFSISSELGSSSVPWTAVRKVWCFPTFWILVLSRSSQLTVPLASLDEGARELVLGRIRMAGGQVCV